ncbi:probable disease resistance protein At1g61300 [Impatiens glandulifera]|uniref:probable disease resistance protein At1g61300 n=1 Tax=Impatiens glandulifera TaxID=253017 RepID=UPI001FB18E30|nr:probable disease resistance protein At1g61300 [Impatiens glandulifera]
MKNDVQAREDAEMRKQNTLGEIVKLWIVNADGIVVEAESLINDKAELRKGCFSIKWCPNISLRFSLGRKGKKLSLVIIQLLQSGGELPHTGHALPMPPINMRNYNGDARDFDSRSQIMEDVIEKLRDEKTMLIGICGMGGIGKTTLAKQALQKVQDFHKPLFTIQIITTVSSSPNFNAIQQEVAEMLGFSLKDVDGEIVRAERLRNALSNKRVVVLLDDVWEEFDLNAKGFPLTKSDVVGCCCKIIYTSRTQGLWLGERNIKQEFPLELLSPEEALNLFQKKVDLKIVDSDFYRKNEIAREIVDECKGLPLALNVAGGALIEKGTHQWLNMLNRLKKHHEHDHVIYEILKTSYDFLEGHIERFLFLLCCLFQEDAYIPVETLYRYATGLNLFKDTSDPKEISVGVHTVVDNLIMKNLLIKVEYGNDDDKNRVVKMHDVVRDVGISIAKQEQNGFSFLACHGVHEQEIVFSSHIKNISILSNEKDIKVSDRMELGGSKLELIRFEYGSDSSRFYESNIKISGNLFQGADNLKVLDIVGFGSLIIEFPLFSYFPHLAKLKMLSLVRLSLNMTTNVSFIRNLSCLEVLSFRDSTIKDLPYEISELTNLRLLDLTQCKCFIINGVLSKLTNLQELYMWEGFQDWRLQKEDVNGGDNNAAGLDELNCLHKLWKLELEVPNIEQVPRGVRLFSSSALLEQFKVRMGGEYERNTQFESGKRQLWLENDKNNTTSFLYELGILIEKGITNLFISNDLGMWEKMHLNSFLSLREVVLKNCGSVITLFPQSESQISKIEEINGLGRYLQCIEIYECNQMRHLCSTLRHLKNLQILVLQNCEMMEEMVNICDEDEQLNKIEFNALETLKLHYLSRMECFCKGINEIYFHKLKTLELKGLKNFIFPTQVRTHINFIITMYNF